MENILEKTVKENGNIDLNDLSWKQLVALINIWDTDYAKKENVSFSEMVKRCYKSRPWNENANIIYLHRDNQSSIADYIIHNAENGAGWYEYFDDSETEDNLGEPTQEQIDELEAYLEENYNYLPE